MHINTITASTAVAVMSNWESLSVDVDHLGGELGSGGIGGGGIGDISVGRNHACIKSGMWHSEPSRHMLAMSRSGSLCIYASWIQAPHSRPIMGRRPVVGIYPDPLAPKGTGTRVVCSVWKSSYRQSKTTVV